MSSDTRDPEENRDEEMIYGLTVNERDALQAGLMGLPETMPPRIVWQRIQEQAEAEGLIRRSPLRRHSNWYAGLGLAAAIVLAVIVLPRFSEISPGTTSAIPGEYPTVPVAGSDQAPVTLNVLEALMVESRQLESDLRALPNEPRVVRAGTQATIIDLEDRIAAIDYQLSDPDSQLSRDDREIFWSERVRLMKSLVRLRYAQAQRTAF